MQKLNISTRLLSEATWRRIFESSGPRLIDKKQSFFELMASLEELRKLADYNTGSISASSAWALYSVVTYFQPTFILEVGTFIGKSTLAMALGLDDSLMGTGEIHTCDKSNEILLPNVTKTPIVQYSKKTSTEMFTEISSTDGSDNKFEMLHLDGRAQEQDFPLLSKICNPEIIVALDDFEGFEKGVANLVNLRNFNLFPSHLLIYPPSDPFLRTFGFFDHSTTALLIPQATLQLTSQ